MFTRLSRRARAAALPKRPNRGRRVLPQVELLEDRLNPGVLTFTPVVFVNTAAPGPEGGQFVYLEFESLNNAGQLAFGGGVPEGEGLFVQTQGAIAQALRSGETAPGGGIFGPVGLFGPTTINAGGDAAGVFLLKNRNPADPNPLELPVGVNAGVYRVAHDTLAVTASEVPDVTGAPGGAAGEVFKGAGQGVGLNAVGDLVFTGIVLATIGPGVDATHNLGEGIFESPHGGGPITKIVRPGDPAPGGKTFDFAENPSINDRGDVAFGAHVHEDPLIQFPGESLPNAISAAESIYLRNGTTGTIQSIAHQGDAVPAAAGSGTFDYAFGPVVNNPGQILFVGALRTDPPQDNPGADPRGLFLFAGGNLQAVARPGMPMPGGGNLVNVSVFTGNYDLNNNGDVAFTATLDTGSPNAPDEGLYLWSNGTLSLVTRTGAALSSSTVQSFDSQGPGSISFEVSLNDRGQVLFGAALADGRQGLFLANPPPMGSPVAATEGTAFSGEVATFTAPGAQAGDFQAMITWGDGHTSAGTIIAQGGDVFSVQGTNTYAEEGSYNVSLALTPTAGGNTLTASTTAQVADALLTPSSVTVGVTGMVVNDAVVATFTDAGGPEAVGNYSASITWGDGSAATSGTIRVSGNTFRVNGSHTYAGSGNFMVSVQIQDEGGSTATATSAATVGTPNVRFVAQLFRDVLGREADANGLAFFSGALDKGVSRIQVVLALEGSPEYRTRQVQGLYKLLLHRAADPVGLDASVRFLAAGGSDEQLAAILAGSPEYFQSRGQGSNDGFLTELYQDLLHRDIDVNGRMFFSQVLSNATVSRGAVAAALLGSDEFHTHLVNFPGQADSDEFKMDGVVHGFYQHFLHRDADQLGLNFFVGALKVGLTDEVAIALLAGSDEYFKRQ